MIWAANDKSTKPADAIGGIVFEFARLGGDGYLRLPRVAHHIRLQFQILPQRTPRFDAQPFQHPVISPHGFLGRYLILGDQAQELDERQLMFGVVDLAP